MDSPFVAVDEPRIVFDSAGIVVVAKPAGMHCAPGGEPGTLCSWLFAGNPSLAGVAGHAPGEGGLLHRLDSATSGLVAFAADGSTFNAMARSAAAGMFRKTYRALGVPGAAGLPGSRPLSGVPLGIDAAGWLGALRTAQTERLAGLITGTAISCRFRPYGPKGARVACALPDDPIASKAGGKAWTRVAYTSDFGPAESLGDGVLVEIVLTRGFRHQIRAQMAWIGLALQGDPLYGAAEIDENLHLQATRLEMDVPRALSPIIVSLDACQ